MKKYYKNFSGKKRTVRRRRFPNSLFIIHNSRKGFTLIETVLYVTILSIIIGFSILIFYQVLSSEVQNRLRRETETEADFLMRKIIWALTGAQTISQPAASASSSVLTISKYNFPANPLTFDLSAGAARLSRAGGQSVPLTSSNVQVARLIFYHTASSSWQPESIRFTLSIAVSSSETAVKASTTLENTIYLP